jgi:hypothetical protein
MDGAEPNPFAICRCGFNREDHGRPELASRGMCGAFDLHPKRRHETKPCEPQTFDPRTWKAR